MIRHIVIATACLATGHSAHALSCLRPSVADSYAMADHSDARFVVVLGRLEPMAGVTIPEPGGDLNAREGYSVEVAFTGRMGTRDGFGATRTMPVTVKVECVGAWCGGVPTEEAIMFLERAEDDRLLLVESACPRWVLPATAENIDAVEACLSGGACAPPG